MTRIIDRQIPVELNEEQSGSTTSQGKAVMGKTRVRLFEEGATPSTFRAENGTIRLPSFVPAVPQLMEQDNTPPYNEIRESLKAAGETIHTDVHYLLACLTKFYNQAKGVEARNKVMEANESIASSLNAAKEMEKAGLSRFISAMGNAGLGAVQGGIGVGTGMKATVASGKAVVESKSAMDATKSLGTVKAEVKPEVKVSDKKVSEIEMTSMDRTEKAAKGLDNSASKDTGKTAEAVKPENTVSSETQDAKKVAESAKIGELDKAKKVSLDDAMAASEVKEEVAAKTDQVTTEAEKLTEKTDQVATEVEKLTEKADALGAEAQLLLRKGDAWEKTIGIGKMGTAEFDREAAMEDAKRHEIDARAKRADANSQFSNDRVQQLEADSKTVMDRLSTLIQMENDTTRAVGRNIL